MTQKTTALQKLKHTSVAIISWYIRDVSNTGPALYHSALILPKNAQNAVISYCQWQSKAHWSVSLLFLTVKTRPPCGLKAKPEEGRLCLTWNPPFLKISQYLKYQIRYQRQGESEWKVSLNHVNFMHLKWIDGCEHIYSNYCLSLFCFELYVLNGCIKHVDSKFYGRILQRPVQRPALVWMCTEGANTPSRSEPNPMDQCTAETGVTGQNLSLSSYL